MRELVTTLLDLVGMVAVVVAVSLAVYEFRGVPLAVATFGLGLLAVSQVIEARAPKQVRREELD